MILRDLVYKIKNAVIVYEHTDLITDILVVLTVTNPSTAATENSLSPYVIIVLINNFLILNGFALTALVHFRYAGCYLRL